MSCGVTKACGKEFVVPEELKDRIVRAVALTKECFDAKANDGKIVNAEAMDVYFDLMAQYKELGFITEEEIEDQKSFDTDFQAAVDNSDANNDGFIDFEEFKVLINEAKATYVKSLFSTYDLDMDGFITQDEMTTVVDGIENPVRSKKVRQIFDMLLTNYDADDDGRISLNEFSESMRKMKW